MESPPVLVAGTFSIYRFYSVGEDIDLARAMASLRAPSAHRRQSSGVRQADSIQIAQPPLRIELGSGSLSVGRLTLEGMFRATIYDLGEASADRALVLEATIVLLIALEIVLALVKS